MRRFPEKRLKPGKTGQPALVGEAQTIGGGFGLGGGFGIIELGEMDDTAISAEIVVAQLRESVEAEPLDHQRVELPGEEIGEVERARLLLGERGKRLFASKEGVAVRPLDAPDALFGEDAVEFAAGAAVAVEAEDLVVGVTVGADFLPHRLGNALGTVVQASPAGTRGRWGRGARAPPAPAPRKR